MQFWEDESKRIPKIDQHDIYPLTCAWCGLHLLSPVRKLACACGEASNEQGSNDISDDTDDIRQWRRREIAKLKELIQAIRAERDGQLERK